MAHPLPIQRWGQLKSGPPCSGRECRSHGVRQLVRFDSQVESRAPQLPITGRRRQDDVDIEFLPGNLSLLCGGVSYDKRLNYQGTPEMGSSIGIRGDDGEGTLGGAMLHSLRIAKSLKES